MTGSDKIEELLEEYKKIHATFLDFINSEENIEENFNNLDHLFEDVKIRDCQHELRLFLRMLLVIANNHHRGPNFFSKIDRILQYFKEDIKKYFSNSEIFDLFKSNKRILLFLIEEKIIIVDEYFVKTITDEKYSYQKYPQYFAPEIKHFMNEYWFPKYDSFKWVKEITEELPENFYELRKKGENDSYLCKLIREDSIKDFICYVNKNDFPLNSKINQSIYETNSILINDEIGLIEYVSYFGSIQIFTYLKNEGIELNSYLFCYSICSQNSEFIKFLEDNIKIEKDSFIQYFEVSIKCHHNDITNYLLYNYLPDEYKSTYILTFYTFRSSLEFYNFSFLNKEELNESSFGKLCNYDYYSIVKILLASNDININNKIITTEEIQYHIF